jgi:hypothetical protein
MSDPLDNAERGRMLRRIRALLVFYAAALIASGLTAVPVEWELRTLVAVFWGDAAPGTTWWPAMHTWIVQCRDTAADINVRYPYVFYGFDWLAFGVSVIGLLFLGALRDPVRNVWVVQFGLICCGLVLVFSSIVPHLRGLPWFWMFVDGSFGVLGAIPLGVILRDIRRLERSDAGAPVTRSA